MHKFERKLTTIQLWLMSSVRFWAMILGIMGMLTLILGCIVTIWAAIIGEWEVSLYGLISWCAIGPGMWIVARLSMDWSWRETYNLIDQLKQGEHDA